MRAPRVLARAFARANGYFWLPCPVCGEEFGGHEWEGYQPSAIAVGPHTGQGICRRCSMVLSSEGCPVDGAGNFIWPIGEVKTA